MPYKFTDKDGNLICFDTGYPDPNNYPPSVTFPEGWKWEIVSADEIKPFISSTKGGRLKDPPMERLDKLEKYNDVLIDVLEDELKLERGTLKERIKVKL